MGGGVTEMVMKQRIEAKFFLISLFFSPCIFLTGSVYTCGKMRRVYLQRRETFSQCRVTHTQLGGALRPRPPTTFTQTVFYVFDTRAGSPVSGINPLLNTPSTSAGRRRRLLILKANPEF